MATYETPSCTPTLAQLQADPGFLSRMAVQSKQGNSTNVDMVQSGDAERVRLQIWIGLHAMMHTSCRTPEPCPAAHGLRCYVSSDATEKHVGMAQSRDVLCAFHGTPAGPSVLASILFSGTCAWNGLLSKRRSVQGLAVMPSAHIQRMHGAGQA